MFNNVPDRFIPEGTPAQIYPLDELEYVYNTTDFNATYEILDHGIQENDWDDNIAVRVHGTEEGLTYEELQSQVNRLGGGFKELGVESGDRVFWCLDDRPETIITQLAIWKIGAVNVPSVPLERARELQYYINDTEASVVVASENTFAEVKKALEENSTVENTVVIGTSRKNNCTFEDLLQSDPITEHKPTDPFDAASILYTGGTTGKPKGCIHSHAAEVSITDLEAGRGRALGESDVCFAPAPIGHALGNGEKVNFPFRFGASIVLGGHPNSEEMLEVMEEHNVSIFAGSPTMLRMMLDEAKISSYDLSSIRLMILGGEMFDEDTYERWKKTTGIDPCNTVGMTPFRHWFLTPYEHGEKRDMTSPLSVGKLRKGYEGKVVDLDDPEVEVERGEIGQLAIRGPTNITYWNNIHPEMPQKMEQDSIEDWGLADDAYRRDENGFLHFVTRLDNMIVSGGRQISGPEVEEVLIQYDEINEVAIVGSPDQTHGEIVKAFIKPEGGSGSQELKNQIRHYAKEKMATYKYPREIEFVEELPKDEVGKIQRAELRERETK
jgi:2-aminobenzoate-CoA ligase